MPDLDSLKAIVRAFIESSETYYCGDYASQCGWNCDHCDYFRPEFPEGKAKPHSPDCLVLQAEAVLNDTP